MGDITLAFKTIPNYSRYEISEEGRVFRKEGTYRGRYNSRREQTPALRSTDYLRVNVMADGEGLCKLVNVHRLVALTYLSDSYEEDLTVNHIDKNKLNNHFSNLEWISNVENVRLGHDKETSQYSLEGEILKTWKSAAEAGDTLGINRAGISAVINKRNRSSGGFRWAHGSQDRIK